MANSPVDAALADRTDLDQYGSDKRLLFALQVDYEIEDIHAIAEDALTDGGDDKACDLVFVDRERGEIVVAQSYEAEAPGKTAPDSKAASLHQAVSWLLGATTEDLPERLQDAARDVREALDESVIGRFRVWYVHNCKESENAQRELEQVRISVRAHLDQRGEDAGEIDVTAEEVGPALLASWYEGAQTPILVNASFDLDLPSGVLVADGDNWHAACTTVPAGWLHGIYTTYGSDIFSANVRGYLGSVRSEKNINHGIKESASESPRKFWAFNNGITAVVNDWVVNKDSAGTDVLSLSGIAIVNGAQTTGALGSVASEALSGANVLARFIKCEDLNTVRDIIRFNNRQNPTQAADFRSNDRVQRRLRDEFAELKVIDYSGGRRGGASDVIKRPADNMIAAPVAAQALAAFHGNPSLAYHEKGRIWEDDATYARLFSDRTTARHILFAVSALKSIEREKLRLRGLAQEDMDEASLKRISFLRRRGSQFLLLAGIGACAELLIGRPVSDKFGLRFSKPISVLEGAEAWAPVVDVLMPLAGNSLDQALQTDRGLRSEDSVRSAVETFRSLVESVKGTLEPTFAPLQQNVTLD
jgi:hypothetical protein